MKFYIITSNIIGYNILGVFYVQDLLTVFLNSTRMEKNEIKERTKKSK